MFGLVMGVNVIGSDEIEAIAGELELSVANVQRDYVFGWLIAGLYGSSKLPSGYVVCRPSILERRGGGQPGRARTRGLRAPDPPRDRRRASTVDEARPAVIQVEEPRRE
jgi:hypothetical protein